MSPRHSYHWPPPGPDAAAGDRAAPALAERLAELVEDRVSSASSLVREASQRAVDWVLASSPDEWGWEQATRELDEGLEAFGSSQGWRGAVAHWLEDLRRTVRTVRPPRRTPREVLGEELGLWLGGVGAAPGSGAWSGEPLTAGERLPAPSTCAAPLVADMAVREVVLVHGWSEPVLHALIESQERGLAPRAILSEGGPDLGGRRLAERLVARGVSVDFRYDVALFGALPSADRVWLGTEAIGADAFLGPVGTTALLAEARRCDVPTSVLATSAELMPRGELSLPAFCQRDRWLLWEDAPEGVRVESQAFEAVPLHSVDLFATENGLETAAELALRSLSTLPALEPTGLKRPEPTFDDGH